MVSNDTKKKTEELLAANRCFGLKRKQISLVEQGEGVPALVDNEAHIAVDPDNQYKIVTKPHGHGDIHALLHKSGVTKNWEANYGIKYIVMFQVRRHLLCMFCSLIHVLAFLNSRHLFVYAETVGYQWTCVPPSPFDAWSLGQE
jgi:hypothetical protein